MVNGGRRRGVLVPMVTLMLTNEFIDSKYEKLCFMKLSENIVDGGNYLGFPQQSLL